jgi:hypothetical protein
MRRILAIASISMRTAFRSKVFLTLLALLVLVIFGLPLTIKGDGTAAGYVRILIEYTLNFVRFILAAAVIWSGCAAISQEVESRQIQMTATKPVHPISIWIGKWLGIIAPVALLTLLAGAVVYGILSYKLHSSQWSEAERSELRREILVGRSRILPLEPEGFSQEVEKIVADVIARDQLPANASESDLRRSVRQTLVTRRQTVTPGASCRWGFELPRIDRASSATLVAKPSSSVIGGVLLAGRLRLLEPSGEVLHERSVQLASESENGIELDGSLLAGRERLMIEFENLNEDYTVIFPNEDSFALMVHSGGFALNYIKTVLIIIGQLALLSSIAVTMGAVFSTPVAAFVSIFMLMLVFMDGYIQEMAQKTDYTVPVHSHGHDHQRHEEPEGPGLGDRYMHLIFVSLDSVTAPLRQPSALQYCSTGIYVSWRMLGETLAFHVIIYGGALALIGAGIFKRRELALPQR